MRSKILAIAILFVFVLTGCSRWELVEQVHGRVVGKEYKPPYTTIMPLYTGKHFIMIPRTHPAEYNVYIVYKELKTVINDKNLYNVVDIGDVVKLNLYKDPKGNFQIRYEGN